MAAVEWKSNWVENTNRENRKDAKEVSKVAVITDVCYLLIKLKYSCVNVSNSSFVKTV